MVKCHYCGQERRILMLDLKDFDKGIEHDNIVWCCQWCKAMKCGRTKEQFLEQVKQIYKLYCKGRAT